jgi:hypothetical protein
MHTLGSHRVYTHGRHKIKLFVSKGVTSKLRNWLRHCATSRKVAGSIPGGVIENLHLHALSGRTVAPGLSQPLTDMSTRNISGGGGVKAAGE